MRGHGKVEPEARSHASPSSGGKRSQLFSGAFMNRKLIGRGWEGVPPPFCAESYATSARSLPRLGDAGAPRPQSFFHVPGAGLPEYAQEPREGTGFIPPFWWRQASEGSIIGPGSQSWERDRTGK